MHIVYPAVVAALLFSIGVYGVLARRNTILVLMSVELMLNAVNLNLVAFDVWLGDRLHSGQVLTLFVIVIAAAEVGVGLAIILALFRNRKTVDIDHLRDLAEPADDPTPEDETRNTDPHAHVPADAVPALAGVAPLRSPSRSAGTSSAPDASTPVGRGEGQPAEDDSSTPEGQSDEDAPSTSEGPSAEDGRHVRRGGGS
ncbi:hypothetical protein GCM10023096_86210 [Nonomuraea ferruginea]|nr:NADH-quinone oxidoreductase subunit NuoK [Nonomuraea ferruginea]